MTALRDFYEIPISRVRWAARAGAALVFCGLGFWLTTFSVTAPPSGSGAFGAAIEAFIEESARATSAPPPPRSRALDSLPTAHRTSSAEDSLDVRLWDYGASGEIIFASRDQLARCNDARARRLDSSDCPSREARAALTWAQRPGTYDFIIEPVPPERRSVLELAED